MATGYRGRNGHTVERLVGGDWEPLPLQPSLDVNNHSPTGFSWGYWGSGPAQLALALILDATGDKDLAQHKHQAFKMAAVAEWPIDGEWEIQTVEILAWLAAGDAIANRDR